MKRLILLLFLTVVLLSLGACTPVGETNPETSQTEPPDIEDAAPDAENGGVDPDGGNGDGDPEPNEPSAAPKPSINDGFPNDPENDGTKRY